MANPHGNPNLVAGPGRPKGLPNKASTAFKEALVDLLESCAPDIISWVREIAEKDKSAALGHLERLAEFCHPKLARAEIKHEGKIELTNTEDDAKMLSRFMSEYKPPAETIQ